MSTFQNKSLNDIIKHSEYIYNKFRNNFMFEELKTMNLLYQELELLHCTLSIVNKNISEILNKSKKIFSEHISEFRNTLKIIENINISNSINDKFEPILSDKSINKLIIPDKQYKNTAPNVKIPVILIDNIKDLPNYNIFYIKNIEQFAIKINGQILRGNIGNISTTKNKQIKNTKKCIYKSNCNNLITNTCDFYHDILDHKNHTSLLKEIIKQRKIKKNHILNYNKQNWIYTSEPINIKNNHMKHIGSRNKLNVDINIISKSEIELIKDMLLHDLLVNLSIYHNC